MPIENLSIERLVIHEVFRRGDERQVVPPRYGAGVIRPDADACNALQSRVTTALGRASHSLVMEIVQRDDQSAIAWCRSLADHEDPDFVMFSRALADKLAGAQTSRRIPGGVLFVFTGSVGYPARRYVGLIKAEPHDGFTHRAGGGGGLNLAFLRDLILTPQAKLYKIGLFVEDNPNVVADADPVDGWVAHVFDDNISDANRGGAALYFYETFLGCRVPEDSAWRTKQFYEETREFVRNLPLPPEDKLDLQTGLYSYLRVDLRPLIQVQEFANQYLPDPETRDAYTLFMRGKRFPDAAVQKDISDIRRSLRLRRVDFPSGVRLTAPPETFTERVQIAAMDAPDGGQWTLITVRDRISDPA